MFAGVASVQAQTPDEAFVQVVTSLGIQTTPGTDLPAVGHQVCDMLTSGLTGAAIRCPRCVAW